MYRISAIAENTFKEMIRKRTLNLLFLFGLLVIGGGSSFVHWGSTIDIKIVKDTGLALLTFVGMLIAIFGTAALIPQDVESGTAMMTLAQPVRRFEFVLGKWIGAILTVGLGVISMAAVFFAVIAAKRSGFDLELIKALTLICFKLFLLVSIAITISTVASSIFNATFCFLIYVLGHLTSYFAQLLEHTENLFSRFFVFIIQALIPNFHSFDIQNAIVLGNPVSWGYVGRVVGYASIYSAVTMGFAFLFFNNREI